MTVGREGTREKAQDLHKSIAPAEDPCETTYNHLNSKRAVEFEGLAKLFLETDHSQIH